MSGWIKLHRKIVDWEWYTDSNTFRLYLHLLLKANHKDNNYRGKLIKQGCLVTGRDELAHQTGLTVRQVRTCLERLKSTNEIAIKSSSKGTEIHIVKYSDYQIATNETTDKMPLKRPASDQQTTTNNNVKNDKEEKEEVIYRKFNHLKITIKDFERLNEIYDKDDIDMVLNNIENYKNNKNYTSLYLTSLNWLKKDYKTKQENINNHYKISI